MGCNCRMLDWFVVRPTLMLLLAAVVLPSSARAQGTTGTIRGTVTNVGTGAPLANAQIVVVGTGNGTITSASGAFTITAVPAGARIVRARMLGYVLVDKPTTVTAGATTTVDFALTVSAIALDEVVVTGTGGSARKREVGNSIGQIKVADVPEVATNLSQMLSGRLAASTGSARSRQANSSPRATGPHARPRSAAVSTMSASRWAVRVSSIASGVFAPGRESSEVMRPSTWWRERPRGSRRRFTATA